MNIPAALVLKAAPYFLAAILFCTLGIYIWDLKHTIGNQKATIVTLKQTNADQAYKLKDQGEQLDELAARAAVLEAQVSDAEAQAKTIAQKRQASTNLILQAAVPKDVQQAADWAVDQAQATLSGRGQ